MTNDPGGRSGTIEIGGYIFEGPFDTPLELQDRPGVYVILDVRGTFRRMIDVGESPAVRSRVMDHDRRICWAQKSRGTLRVAVHYTHSAQLLWRKQIKEELSKLFVPPCQGET